ncbi:MAG TPA: SHOCT domain-containing protein [Solirubrobacterales bacterium]
MIDAMTLLLADSDWDSHMGDWGAGWWIVMMIGMVVFWGLVILGVVWIVRELGSGSHRGSHHRGGGADDPLAILDRRFAEGEISAKEYEQRRKILSG